jgi:hypothetical protein
MTPASAKPQARTSRVAFQSVTRSLAMLRVARLHAADAVPE